MNSNITNANYIDDTSDYAGNMTYSSLSGRNGCDRVGGYSEYQMANAPFTPSSCNFFSDYGTVAQEYTATPIPTVAALQYYPWDNALQLKDGRIYAPKVVDVAGTVVYPKAGNPNVQAQQFLGGLNSTVTSNVQARIDGLQARLLELQAQPQNPVTASNIDAIQKQIAALKAGLAAQAIQQASAEGRQAVSQGAPIPQGTFAQPAQAIPTAPVASPVAAVPTAGAPGEYFYWTNPQENFNFFDNAKIAWYKTKMAAAKASGTGLQNICKEIKEANLSSHFPQDCAEGYYRGY